MALLQMQPRTARRMIVAENYRSRHWLKLWRLAKGYRVRQWQLETMEDWIYENWIE